MPAGSKSCGQTRDRPVHTIDERRSADETSGSIFNSFLPGFGSGAGYGGWAWDVSNNIVTNLQPYGLTVPMWFCPVRPEEFQGISTQFQKRHGRQISSLSGLS